MYRKLPFNVKITISCKQNFTICLQVQQFCCYYCTRYGNSQLCVEGWTSSICCPNNCNFLFVGAFRRICTEQGKGLYTLFSSHIHRKSGKTFELYVEVQRQTKEKYLKPVAVAEWLALLNAMREVS